MMSYMKGHVGYLMLRSSHLLLTDVSVLLTLDRAVELTATGQLHVLQEKLLTSSCMLPTGPKLDAMP